MSRLLVICVFVSSLTTFASTNKQSSVSDPQAVAYAAQSIAAMGTLVVHDVTLTGNVTWTAGSDTEDGTATFLASDTGQSRMDLALASGTRTEIRDASTGSPMGKWIAPNGTSGKFAFHNCLTDAVWFFPALGSLAAGPNVVLRYMGRENRNGTTVQHIQSNVYQAGQTSSLSGPQLSTTDFYLDAATLLPVAVTFNAHPDNDASTNLSVEVDFSNYQTISGVTVPMHIQRYLQGNLLVDVTISGASFNTGLSLSAFAVN